MGVGLYFDNENIAIVETKKSRKGIELLSSYKTTFDESNLKEEPDIAGASDDVSAELKTLAHLQRAIRESKITSRDVIFSLPTKELTVRSFSMPLIPKSEWSASVRFEARKYLPFALDDIVSEFFIKRASTKKKEMEVTFIACPKKTVDKYVSLLKELDLKVIGFEAEAFSLLRAVQFKFKKEKLHTAAMLKWHNNSGCILIIEDGMPRLVRDFSFPLIKDYSDEQIPQKLVNELRLSFVYYKRQFGKGDKIDIGKIYLCVDEANSKWDEILKRNLGVDVDVVFPFSAIKNISVGESYTPPLYTALGASLKGIVSAPFQINLLAEEKEMIRYYYEMSKLLKAVVTLGVICVLGLYVLLHQRVIRLDQELQKILAKRSKVDVPNNLDIEQLGKLSSEKRAKLNILNNLFDKRQYLTMKLETLAKFLPDGVWLEGLSFREDIASEGMSLPDFIITGYAYLKDKGTEIDAINRFVSNLKLDANFSESFKDIDLSYVKETELMGYKVTSFELRCTK